MESIAVGLIGVAIVWLIFWIVRNEDARSIKDQKGLFRMSDHEQEEQVEEKGRRHRR